MKPQKTITIDGITFELGEFGMVKIVCAPQYEPLVNLSDLIKAATKLRKRILDKVQKDAAAAKLRDRKKAAKDAKRKRAAEKALARKEGRKAASKKSLEQTSLLLDNQE